MVLEDARVLPGWELAGDLNRRLSLVEGDLEEDPAAGVQALDSFSEDAPMQRQAVWPAIERLHRLILADAAIQRRDVAAGNVGGIGDDQVEGLRIDDGAQ